MLIVCVFLFVDALLAFVFLFVLYARVRFVLVVGSFHTKRHENHWNFLLKRKCFRLLTATQTPAPAPAPTATAVQSRKNPKKNQQKNTLIYFFNCKEVALKESMREWQSGSERVGKRKRERECEWALMASNEKLFLLHFFVCFCYGALRSCQTASIPTWRMRNAFF